MTALFLLIAIDAIRTAGHGGTLLVLPEKAESADSAMAWLHFGNRRLSPPVSLEPAYAELRPTLVDAYDPFSKMMETPIGPYLLGKPDEAYPALVRAIRALGDLCAVDGAVVLSERLGVIGFGATIRPPSSAAGHTETIRRRSVLGGPTEIVRISELGGTRRQSAGLMVANTFDVLALTSSHDGPLSIAGWGLESGTAVATLLTDVELFLD